MGLCLAALSSAPAAAGSPASAIVINRNSGMCLETPDAAKTSGPLDQRRCLDLPHQQWSMRPVKGGLRIVNLASGKCLDVEGGAETDGARLVQARCVRSDSQIWKARTQGQWLELRASHSNKCLDVANASIDDAAAVIQWPCHGGKNQRWTVSEGPDRSAWSHKIPLTMIPVAASTLRNGKILAWAAYDRFNFSNTQDHGKTWTTIYDPATNTATEKLVARTGHDMFCPGTATLPDGRILVNGGSSSAKTSIYDPATNQWTTGATMNVPRGYQGDTVLSTGEVLTIGGSWSGGLGHKIGEVWSAAGGWRSLPKVKSGPLSGPDPEGPYRADNQMWLFGTSAGVAFHAGPSARMHWIDTEGDGSIMLAGTRGDDEFSMNGNVVMYEAGKILKVGGAPAYQYAQATDAAYTIDFSKGPGAPVDVVKQKAMAFPRAFSNAVVLPNGQVVVVGGMNYAVPFIDDRSIMIPEIWTPATGAFTRLAAMSTPRNYHSVATLMLDGRVFVGGGGLCGPCDTNHPDAEILTPPYLFDADGAPAARPAIQTAPTSAAPGQQISVTTDRTVSSFALVRLSAVTHAVNNDQRRIELPIAGVSGQTYLLHLPSDGGVLLAGDWMLFAMTSAGTPSVAKVVRVR